jgi:hypothetical protein
MAAVVFQETNRDTEYEKKAIFKMLSARKVIAAKRQPYLRWLFPKHSAEHLESSSIMQASGDPALCFMMFTATGCSTEKP